ncbi:DMT family transporter [Anaerocolumna sedimenticola]|uniref:DMT family transporter n=1 Tax=Anaerocolumna sedimenticola TaxID=2696063 RepID=UPI002ED3DFA5
MVGIGYGFCAAVLYAGVILLNRFMKGLNGLETTIIQLSTASVVLLPYVLLTEKITIHEWSGKTILYLIIVGIIHTGLAYLLYFTSINKLNGQTTAILSYIDPISAIIMSYIFLGENMTIPQVIGGFLILGAALLNEMFDKAKVTT